MQRICDCYNWLEGFFWIALGLFLLTTSRRSKKSRSQFALCFLLILFGISDFVELQTGAWWRPWWLLIWKLLNALALIGFAYRYWKENTPTPPEKTHSL